MKGELIEVNIYIYIYIYIPIHIKDLHIVLSKVNLNKKCTFITYLVLSD